MHQAMYQMMPQQSYHSHYQTGKENYQGSFSLPPRLQGKPHGVRIPQSFMKNGYKAGAAEYKILNELDMNRAGQSGDY